VARLTGPIHRVQGLNVMARILSGAVSVGIPNAIAGSVEYLGQRIAERAKSYMGHPQIEGHGGFPPWPPLAASTLEKKGANTPLFDTGEMQASVQYAVKSPVEVEIGSNIPYARFQELGTADMPARPFIHPAAIEVTQESLPIIGESIVHGIGAAAIGPRKPR
jgi:HK97 gp10 family phage protein